MVTKMAQMIKKIRKDNGLSQVAFSKRVGASLSVVKKWEKGENEPGTKFLHRICEEFNCDIDYLTGRIGKQKHVFDTVCNVTGLSEMAVKRLIRANKSGYAPTVSHLIESEGMTSLIRSCHTLYDLMDKMEYIDTNYKSVGIGGLAIPDLRIRKNGQVVMNADEAIHHYMNRAAMFLTAILEKDFSNKVKSIRRRSLDDDKFLEEEIEATEEELESLKRIKEWREENENET